MKGRNNEKIDREKIVREALETVFAGRKTKRQKVSRALTCASLLAPVPVVPLSTPSEVAPVRMYMGPGVMWCCRMFSMSYSSSPFTLIFIGGAWRPSSPHSPAQNRYGVEIVRENGQNIADRRQKRRVLSNREKSTYLDPKSRPRRPSTWPAQRHKTRTRQRKKELHA